MGRGREPGMDSTAEDRLQETCFALREIYEHRK